MMLLFILLTINVTFNILRMINVYITFIIKPNYLFIFIGDASWMVRCVIPKLLINVPAVSKDVISRINLLLQFMGDPQVSFVFYVLLLNFIYYKKDFATLIIIEMCFMYSIDIYSIGNK